MFWAKPAPPPLTTLAPECLPYHLLVILFPDQPHVVPVSIQNLNNVILLQGDTLVLVLVVLQDGILLGEGGVGLGCETR